jgi:hypothetical protein
MRGYKEPGFNERTAAAASAKQKALEKLKAKPPVDEAELARQRERQAERDAAEIAKRAAAKQAREDAAAAKREAARLAAEEAAANAPKVLTEEERKAARDARYAARKNRKS